MSSYVEEQVKSTLGTMSAEQKAAALDAIETKAPGLLSYDALDYVADAWRDGNGDVRTEGLAKAVGGVAEVAGAAGLCVETVGTGCGFAASFLGGHGIDTLGTGLYQLTTGGLTDTAFMSGLGQVGLSRNAASYTDLGLILGVSGGTSAYRIFQQNSQISAAIAESAYARETYLNPTLTRPDEAFYWSGRTAGVGGDAVALQIANTKNGTTLEDLIARRDIAMPAWDPTNPASVRAWEEISAQYAKNASGTVRVVLGQQLRPGNVWEVAELPALQANPNVKSVIAIDPLTQQERVIFTRGK